MKNYQSYIIVLLLSTFWIVFACKNSYTESDYEPIIPIATHFNGQGFAGSESCYTCHPEIYKTHLETAHFKTSAIADSSTVKGDFIDGENVVTIGGVVEIQLIKTDTALFQQIHKIENDELLMTSKIDMVIGSGTKGQSYLTWNNDQLSQLQASFFAPSKNWINSPGYPDRLVKNRIIRPRCMECHTTYANHVEGFSIKNRYDKDQIIFGIDCERCHGPSAEHVGFHLSNPDVKEAVFVTSYNELSQQQKLDACALCHSGITMNSKREPFSFVIGDKLAEFSTADYQEVKEIELDVHGNQYGLLTSSKCFQKSEKMDCSSCHDPHKNERNNAGSFNIKCMSCHSNNQKKCIEDSVLLQQNNNDCISCHMPMFPSKSMKITLDRDTIPVEVRTHLIAVYK
ncbi:multiheme c-type cytochrome [Spongiivirga citrea]|uniref:Cytochrome c-552/4 domain-containing protein n=1 Tax=Spongiivirga citrea TaxID=1481457 RepID=A0A6M0CGA1_9FLAO|nr:multiheme c-type cytochrome [Spongiivirga citrea]NER16908.1 hypothetical protein [Spongiivirga citrea]